jgi:hypothetical protein
MALPVDKHVGVPKPNDRIQPHSGNRNLNILIVICLQSAASGAIARHDD